MDNRALLDELMGKDRDLPLDQQKKRKLRYDDPEVCHYYLAAFCPNDLFHNTKSDLGPCSRTHDDNLREDYLKSSKVAVYEGELLSYLDRLILDLERKIKRCQERLDKEIPLNDYAKNNSERIAAIAVEVQALLKQAEKEGEEGLVDQAQETMTKVELLQAEKDSLIKNPVTSEFSVTSVLEKEKRMIVCEVCGAMQASTDTDKRLASHFDGKQHLGYFRIRQTAEQLRKKREDEREARRKSQGVTVDETDGSVTDRDQNGRSSERIKDVTRERSRSRDREKPRDHYRERSRDVEHERVHGSKDRERDSSRNDDRRSRSENREHERKGRRGNDSDSDRIYERSRNGDGERNRVREREETNRDRHREKGDRRDRDRDTDRRRSRR